MSAPKSMRSFQAGLRASGKSITSSTVPTRSSTFSKSAHEICSMRESYRKSRSDLSSATGLSEQTPVVLNKSPRTQPPWHELEPPLFLRRASDVVRRGADQAIVLALLDDVREPAEGA